MERATHAPTPNQPSLHDVLDELDRVLTLLGEQVEVAAKTFAPVLKPNDELAGERPEDADLPTSGMNLRLRRLVVLAERSRAGVMSLCERADF